MRFLCKDGDNLLKIGPLLSTRHYFNNAQTSRNFTTTATCGGIGPIKIKAVLTIPSTRERHFSSVIKIHGVMAKSCGTASLYGMNYFT